MLRKMMGSTVVLPNNMTRVYDGSIITGTSISFDSPGMVVYIDSTGCSSCRIEHLTEYESVKSLMKESSAFEITVIVFPLAQGPISMSRYLSDCEELPFPVYVDEEDDFLSLNPVIPPDPRFHTFFVDSSGKIVLIGDPSRDQSLFPYIKQVFNKL